MPAEVVAIAVALAAAMSALGTEGAAPTETDRGRAGWRWQGWDDVR